jgi:hypothetical protein
MAPTASRRSTDVLWSSDRNAVTKALVGVAVGYCDTPVNLLRRDINETASSFGEAYVTGTPTIYLNEIRYTGATDVQSLLEPSSRAIPKARFNFLRGPVK